MIILIIFVLSFLYLLWAQLIAESLKVYNFSLFPNSSDPATAKWKYPFEPYIPKWYHFGIRHSHAERFAFSSTIFAFLMDARHNFQFLNLVFITSILFALSWEIGLALIISHIAAATITKLIS